jgi:tetratricopeptide (TPR) repeat protein
MTPDDRVRAAAAVIALCAAATARAQSPEAEVLFRDGRRLIQAGQLAEGCDKLEASERLESSVGALLNLGDCREKLGQLASAWAAFRKAEAKAKHAGDDDKRRAEARRRAGLLEPRLSYLVIQVEHPPDGLVVRRDGEPVVRELWNTAVPVDPGTYELTAQAPARRPWQAKIEIDGRLRRRVVGVPALAPAPLPPPVARAPAARTEARLPRRAGTWSTARKVSAGFALAGAGALGTGAYFGWRSRTLADRADRRCPLAACGDREGLQLNAEARTAAARANVLYAAGGAAAVTAAILWLVGRPGDVAIRPGAAGGLGVSLVGRF